MHVNNIYKSQSVGKGNTLLVGLDTDHVYIKFKSNDK